MTSGYILIVAILVLGGVIATVGDRIGSRVGKARLSLFNLRPRKTAVLVTILTGGIISASTLGILFALSDQLRKGVFEIGQIQKQLRVAGDELREARTQKSQVEKELNQSRSTLTTAEKRLDEANQSLSAVVEKQARTESQLRRVASSFLQAQYRLQEVSEQAGKLRSEIQTLQTERQGLLKQQSEVKAQIAQRDQEIATRNQAIVQRDQEIANRDRVITLSISRLKDLESQQAKLGSDVRELDQAYGNLLRKFEGISQGNIAILRDQVLASGVVRIVTPPAARRAIDQLLQEANRAARQRTQPGANGAGQVVQIPKGDVEQLVQQIDDGRDYVLRVVSLENYVVGEKNVQVVASATLNQVVFPQGGFVASTSVDPSRMSERQIREKIELLLIAAAFRGNRAGVLTEGIQVGREATMAQFIEQLKQQNRPIDIQVVAAEVIYTAGPLKVQLLAIKDGQVVFRAG